MVGDLHARGACWLAAEDGLHLLLREGCRQLQRREGWPAIIGILVGVRPRTRGLPLDSFGGAALRRADEGVEERLGRSTAVHHVGHGLGVLFVGVTGLADAALQGDAGALLDDVGSLVCGEVPARRVAEGDVVANSVAFGAERVAGVACGAADVRLHAGEVVVAERRLQVGSERHRARRAGNTLRSGGQGGAWRGSVGRVG